MNDSRRLQNLATVVLTFMAGAAMAVLFENGTFDPPLDLGDGLGWEAFGNGVQFEDKGNGAPGDEFGSYGQENDGEYGLVFATASSTNGGFYQDVQVEPGREYLFTIQSNHAQDYFDQILVPSNGTEAILFEWWNGDPATTGSPISTDVYDITSQITDGGSDQDFPPGYSDASNWQLWTITNTAPGGATHLRSIVQWSANTNASGINGEWIRWDNAQLVTSLEPLNETNSTLPVLELTFQTETGRTYRVDASADLQGWKDAGLPGLAGDDTTRMVAIVRDAPVRAYRLNGGPPPPAGTLYSDANDGFLEVRDTLPPTNAWPQIHPETLGNWQANVGEWFGQGLTTIVLPFQLPDFGAVSDPFDSAELGVMVNPNSGNAIVTDIDLYGVRVDPNPAILVNDWYNGAAPDPGATLIQESFLTPSSPVGWDGAANNFTDATGSANLRAYLNTAYAGGTGANQYVFLRMSYGSDTFATGWDAFKINVRESGNPGEWPRISYTGAPVFVFEPTLDPATVPGTVVEWDGQLGVQYQFEYSDDGGTTWSNTGMRVTGTGGRMQATDPAGTVTGRTYRIALPPPVPSFP